MKGAPLCITFDLVDDDSPLIVGLDRVQQCNIFNTAAQKYIEFRRHQDTSTRFLNTYIIPDNIRLHVEISLHPLSEFQSLLRSIHSVSQRAPLTFCNRLHRYTHASAAELESTCEDSGSLREEIDKAIRRVGETCEILRENKTTTYC